MGPTRLAGVAQYFNLIWNASMIWWLCWVPQKSRLRKYRTTICIHIPLYNIVIKFEWHGIVSMCLSSILGKVVKKRLSGFLGPALQGKKIKILTNKQYLCHEIAFKELSQSFLKRYDSPLYIKNWPNDIHLKVTQNWFFLQNFPKMQFYPVLQCISYGIMALKWPNFDVQRAVIPL